MSADSMQSSQTNWIDGSAVLRARFIVCNGQQMSTCVKQFSHAFLNRRNLPGSPIQHSLHKGTGGRCSDKAQSLGSGRLAPCRQQAEQAAASSVIRDIIKKSDNFHCFSLYVHRDDNVYVCW